MWTNKEDPVMTCQPLGIPRQGPPRRIVQSANDIIFFYGEYVDGGGGYGEYRVIPTDGRKHDPKKAIESHVYRVYRRTLGGRHAGARLHLVRRYDVARARRFLPFRPDARVEKLTRKGNQILYEVTVEDPEVLVEPWVMTPRTLRSAPIPRRGTSAGARQLRGLRDEGHQLSDSALEVGEHSNDQSRIGATCRGAQCPLLLLNALRLKRRLLLPVPATLAQLMKGTLYPESNVVFAAQDVNPAEVPHAKDPSMATDPLTSPYGKWEAVENSALAIV